MKSYVWPDQSDRLVKMDAALSIAQEYPVAVVRADAVDWLEERLNEPATGVTRVIYSKIAWQYLPEKHRKTGEQLICQVGARTGEGTPLTWVRFEADEQGSGAALTLDF